MLISSRSGRPDREIEIKGHMKVEDFDRLQHVILNGPKIQLGFNLRRIISWIWFEIQILRSFSMIRKWRPDVIMVSSLSILTFISGIILKKILKIPLIVEVRDIYPLTLVEVAGFKVWNPAVLLLGIVEKAGYKNADQIVSSLPNLGPHVEQRLGYAKSVHWLPMGYDPDFYREIEDQNTEPNLADQQITQTKSDFSVGYCGTVGLANALQASLLGFDLASDELPNAHLWIIGGGNLLDKYKEKFAHNQNIHFLGHQPKKNISKLISHFDVVINPWLDRPIYKYGVSPNKWIDYMQAAKPILAPYGGFKFLIDEHDAGWFIEPESAETFRREIVKLAGLPRTDLVQKGLNGKKLLENNLSYANLANNLHGILCKSMR